MTRIELAEMLERFAGDQPDCGPWEFDDFTSTRADEELEPYRQRLLEMEPPFDVSAIREIAQELRSNA